jgi:hypothetical protein
MTTTLDRYCEVCGEVLTAIRPHARYCSPRCRQSARRSRNGNASSQVSDVQSVTPQGAEGPHTSAGSLTPAGPTADGNYWPRLVVEAFRDADDDEMALVWYGHFRERGEWRQ